MYQVHKVVHNSYVQYIVVLLPASFNQLFRNNVRVRIFSTIKLCFMYSCCLFQYIDMITVVGFTLEVKLVSSKQLSQEHLKILSRSIENMVSY